MCPCRIVCFLMRKGEEMSWGSHSRVPFATESMNFSEGLRKTRKLWRARRENASRKKLYRELSGARAGYLFTNLLPSSHKCR